jgi:uncharacterized protein YndB with AHSA1/START domain
MADTRVEEQAALSIARHYPVSPEKVWRAWTDPQALSRWFGPGDTSSVTQAELDVRVGGRYRIAFGTSDGQRHEVSGAYLEVEPPRKLSFSWAWQSTPERVSRVTIELVPAAGGCEMRFRHDRFFDQAARENHERGWSGALAKLDTLMASQA